MSQFNVVPFEEMDNKPVLTAKQCIEHPWLLEFIKQNPDQFEPHPSRDAMVYYPDGDAPK